MLKENNCKPKTLYTDVISYKYIKNKWYSRYYQNLPSTQTLIKITIKYILQQEENKEESFGIQETTVNSKIV